MLKGLYVLTDDILTPKETMLEQVERVLRLGICCLQLRDKCSDDDALVSLGYELKSLCHQYGTLFCIDDRVLLAKKLQVDMLHIGEHDMSYHDARLCVGHTMMIGVSCYGDLQRAKNHEIQGADYVAFGSFFPSPTKPLAHVVPLSLLDEAKKTLSIPLCAIGGINSVNAHSLYEAGADMVSAVSSVWQGCDDDIKKMFFKENE